MGESNLEEVTQKFSGSWGGGGCWTRFTVLFIYLLCLTSKLPWLKAQGSVQE